MKFLFDENLSPRIVGVLAPYWPDSVHVETAHLRQAGGSARLSSAQIEHIRRTVRRTPEVMVKVTGGGRKIGAVAISPLMCR